MNRYILDQALKKSLRSKYLVQGGAYRFRLFQKWLLKNDVPPNVAGFLSMFAFDGIRVDDFDYVVKSVPIVYADGKVGIAWADGIGRAQRVRLSSMTIHLINQCGWSEILKLSIAVLEEVYQNIAGNKEPLEHFKRDQMAWFAEISSGPMLEHIAGSIPMTALPDSIYARLQTKQALIVKNQYDIDSNAENLFSLALSGFLEPIGEDKNPLIVDGILSICHRKQVHDTSNHKSWMLQQCSELAILAPQYGPVSSLILSWTIDLIANGTVAKADISVSTIVNYVSVAARSIFSEFKGSKFPDWNAADYQLVYKKIIQNISPGQKRNMASSLNTWHRVLVNWLDVPPIPSKLHDEVSELPPHSNVLWQHEYQKILDWLSDSCMDERMAMYLQAMFCVAYCIRIRINELLKLKLSDIKVYENKIELEIKGTKTAAAKRRLLINRECLTHLEVLKNRRESELALDHDYLFADPNKIQKIYRLGSIYALANQLLKVATGDRSIKFHTISHTVISKGASEILMGGTDSLLNPLNQFATDVAHYSILTTCSVYMHTFEDVLRVTIDGALKNLKITSKVAAKWSRDSELALRKRSSRGILDVNELYWRAILENTDITDFPVLSDYFKVEAPLPPKFLSSKNQVDYSKVLNIFTDLSYNHPIERIVLRQSIDQQEVNNFLFQAKQIIINWRLSDQVRYSSSVEQVALLIGKVNGFDFLKVNQPKLGSVKSWLTKNTLSKEVVKWLKSWLNLQKSRYISLNLEPDTRNLILLISKIGIPSPQLAIAFKSDLDKRYLMVLQSIFYECYGVTVPQFSVESRRGRPDVYLIFSSSRVHSQKLPKPASTSLSGLNALLFAALVFSYRSRDVVQ
jgi:integrase